MIAFGCEDKNKTPIPEERTCPQCGREIEVFLSQGRVIEDATCECGYVIKAQQPIVTIPDIQGSEINREVR